MVRSGKPAHGLHSLATRLALLVLGAALAVSLAMTTIALHALDDWTRTHAAEVERGGEPGAAAAHGNDPVQALSRRMLGLGFTLSLLAALVMRASASRVLRPIETLSYAALQISAGEGDVELPDSTGNDEISVLAHSFGEMQGRLADRAQRLETSQREIEEINQRLRTQNGELQRVNEVLGQLSITDGLTKLHNHRFFHEHLAREVKRADRSAEPLALILVDIDHFKQWNDELGHAAGDEILRGVADVMNGLIRETDLLARYGGEEFALIAPNTDCDGAVQLAEKIRVAISQKDFVLAPPSERRALTVSIGVALYSGDPSELFNAADRALYSAKEQGRDCVVTASDCDAEV